MSQKRTVTCFRSPSNAEREVLGGVSLRGGELCRGHGGGRDFERVWPSWLQKRLPGALARAQDGQVTSRRAPQELQNLASCGFSCWHWRHFIPGTLVKPGR